MSREFSSQPNDVSPGPSSPTFDGSSPIFSDVVLSRDSREVTSVTFHPFESHTKQGIEPKSESAVRWQPPIIRDESIIDAIKSASSARIVTVTIWSDTADADGYCNTFVVERKTVWGPVDRSDWLLLLPKSAREQCAMDDSALVGWQKAIGDWSAKKLEEPPWKQYTEYWDLSRNRGIASIADGLDSLQGQWHDLLLKQPAEFASKAVGLASPTGALLSGIVSEHRLPGDALFKDLKLAIQVTGTVAGLATGNFHMVHACLASYMRDRATEIVSDELAKLFKGKPEKVEQQLIERVYTIETPKNSAAREKNPLGPPPPFPKTNEPLGNGTGIDPEQVPSNYGHPGPPL
jgi:hypothetical protein